jgi:hypothetical protein
MLRLAILCLMPSIVSAQEASLILAGNVVNGQTGEPIPRALVVISGFLFSEPTPIGAKAKSISRSVLTDAGGAFRFMALPEARYVVRTQKPGFAAETPIGSRQNVIELKSSREDVRLTLSALGIITGNVVDENGEAMRGVGIEVLSSNVENGLRQNRLDRTVITDDLGAYRISDLSPGKYFLKATSQGGGSLLFAAENAGRLDIGDSFAPVYLGAGQTMESAMPVEIGTAARAKGDFRLKLEPAFQIRGTLRNFSPRESVTFALVIAGEQVPAGPDLFNAGTGAFEFKDVVSGSYVLRAFQGDKSGEVAVHVTGVDTAGAVLQLYPPVATPVTVRFTNSASPIPQRGLAGAGDGENGDRFAGSDICSLFLSPEQFNGAVIPAPRVIFMRDNVLHDVPSGKRRVSISCPDGYVRSAVAGAQDLLANPVLTIEPGANPPPVEILASHGGGSITGKMDDSLFGGRSQLQFLLVPQFAGATGPQLVSVAPQPQMNVARFSNLAPGTYTLYAFARQDIEYRNPAFLQSLSGGQSIQIDGDAEKEVTIDRVIP